MKELTVLRYITDHKTIRGYIVHELDDQLIVINKEKTKIYLLPIYYDNRDIMFFIYNNKIWFINEFEKEITTIDVTDDVYNQLYKIKANLEEINKYITKNN